MTQLNAHLNAGGTVSVTTGRDATFAGVVVKTKDIDLDIGRNLTVASQQDTAHSSSSSANAEGSVNIGIIGPSSVSLSGGGLRGSADSAWVTEEAGLFASNKLPFERGIAIEKRLAQTEYSESKGWFYVGAENNGYFRLLDFQRGTIVLSLKSADPTSPTWLARVQTAIDDLGVSRSTVNDYPATLLFDLRVPPGSKVPVESLVQYGLKRSVTVIVKEYP